MKETGRNRQWRVKRVGKEGRRFPAHSHQELELLLPCEAVAGMEDGRELVSVGRESDRGPGQRQDAELHPGGGEEPQELPRSGDCDKVAADGEASGLLSGGQGHRPVTLQFTQRRQKHNQRGGRGVPSGKGCQGDCPSHHPDPGSPPFRQCRHRTKPTPRPCCRRRRHHHDHDHYHHRHHHHHLALLYYVFFFFLVFTIISFVIMTIITSSSSISQYWGASCSIFFPNFSTICV